MTRTVSWKETRRFRVTRRLILPRGFPAIFLLLAMIYAAPSEAEAGKRAARMLRGASKSEGSDYSRKDARIDTRRNRTTTSEESTEKEARISPALDTFLQNVLRAQDELKWIDNAGRHAEEKEKQQNFATRSLRSLRGPFHRPRSRIRSKRRYDTFAESQGTTTAETKTDEDDDSPNGEPERFWLDEDMQFKRSADFFDPDGRSYRKSRRKQERSADEGPAVDDSTLKQWARQEGLRYPGDWLAFHDNSRKDDDPSSNGEDEADFSEPADTFRRQRDASAITKRRKMAAERPTPEKYHEIQPSLPSLRKTLLKMSKSLGGNDRELNERNASALKTHGSREARERDRDVSSGVAEDVDRGYRRSVNKDSNPDEFRHSARSHRNTRARRNDYQSSLRNHRISSDAVNSLDFNGREDEENEEDDLSSERDYAMRRPKRERRDDAENNARVYRRVEFRGSHLDNRDSEVAFPRLGRQVDSVDGSEADRRRRRSAVAQTRSVVVDETKESVVKGEKIASEDDDSKTNDKSVGERSSASRVGFEGRREDGKQNSVGDESRVDPSANQATIEPNGLRSTVPVENEAVEKKESQQNAVSSPNVAETKKEVEKSEPTDDERHKMSDSDEKDEARGEKKSGSADEKRIDGTESSTFAEDREGSDGKTSEAKATDESRTKDNFEESRSCKKRKDLEEVHPDERQSAEAKDEKGNSKKMKEASGLDDAGSRIAVGSETDEDKSVRGREVDDENQLQRLTGSHDRINQINSKDEQNWKRESNRKRTKERGKRSDDRHFRGDRSREARNGEEESVVSASMRGKTVKRNSKNDGKIGDEGVKVALGKNSKEEVDEENPRSAVENREESDLDAENDAKKSTRRQEAGRKLLGIITDDGVNCQTAVGDFRDLVVSKNSNCQVILPKELAESARIVEKESANGRKFGMRSLMSGKNEDSLEESWRRGSSGLETSEVSRNRDVRRRSASGNDGNTSDFEENSNSSEESVAEDTAKRNVELDAEARDAYAAIEENQDEEEPFSSQDTNDSSSSDLGDEYYDGLVDEDGVENFENVNEDEDRSATDDRLRGREQPEASLDLSDRDPVRDKVNVLIKQKLKDRREGKIAYSKGKLAQPAEIVQYSDYDDEPGESDSDSSIFDYNQRLSDDKDCSDGTCKSSGKAPVKKNKYEEEMKRQEAEQKHWKKLQHEYIPEGDMSKTTVKSKNMTLTSVEPESRPSSDDNSHTTENLEKKGVSEEVRGESPELHENVTRERSNLRSGETSDNDAVNENLKNVATQHQEHHEVKENEKHVGDEKSEVLNKPQEYNVNVHARSDPGTIGGFAIDKLPTEEKPVDRESEKSRDSNGNDPKRSCEGRESKISTEGRDDLNHRNYTDNRVKDDEIRKRENGRRNGSKSSADRNDRHDQRRRVPERRHDAVHNPGVSTSVHRGSLGERQTSKVKRLTKELSTNNADFAEDSLPTMLDRSGTELDTDERTYLVVPPAQERSSSMGKAENSSSSGSNYLALKMTDDLFKGGTEQSNPLEDKIPEPLPIVPATTERQIIRTADARARVQLTDVKNLLTLDPIVLTVAKSPGEFSQNFESPVSEVETVGLDSRFGSNSESIVHESFVEPAEVAAEWEDETRPRFGRGLKATRSIIGSNDGVSAARNQSYTSEIRDATNETRGTMHDAEAGEPPFDAYLKNKPAGFEDEELAAKNSGGAHNGDEKINLAKDGGLVSLGDKIDSDHRAEPKLHRGYETTLDNELQKRSSNDETRSANDDEGKHGSGNIEEWQMSASILEGPNQLSSPDSIGTTAAGENVTNLGVGKNVNTNESRQRGGRLADKSSETVDGFNQTQAEPNSVDGESNVKADVASKVASAMLDTKREHSSGNGNDTDYQRTRRDAESFHETRHSRHWFNENSPNHRYDTDRAELSSDSRRDSHTHGYPTRERPSSSQRIGRHYWKNSANEINDRKHRRDRARSSWQDEDSATWHTRFRTAEHNRHGKHGSYRDRKWQPRARSRYKLGWRNSVGSITKHRENSLHHDAKSVRDRTDVDALSKDSEDHGSRNKLDDITAPLSSVHSKSDKNSRSGFADREARRRLALHGGRNGFRDDFTRQDEQKPEDESQKKNIKVLLAADNMEDESQMNMALHGELAGKIVEQIFNQVEKNSALKSTLGSGLDRKYKAENAIASDKTYRQGLDAEEVKHTEMMMKRVMELLGRLVLDEVQKKTCAALPPDMQDFLQWMLGIDGEDEVTPDQQEIPTTEARDEQGNRSVNDTFLFKSAVRDKSSDDLNKSLGILRSLIKQYNALTTEEKTEVQVVRDYLARQVGLLLRYIEAKERGEQKLRNSASDGIDAPRYENAVASANNTGRSKALRIRPSSILISGNASFATSPRAFPPRQPKFKSRPVRSSEYDEKRKLELKKRDHRKWRKQKKRHGRSREKLSPQYRKLVRRAAMLRHKRGSLYDDNWDPIDSGYEEATVYSSSGKLSHGRSERRDRNLAQAMIRSDVESRNNPYSWADALSGKIRSDDVIGEMIESGTNHERRAETNFVNEMLRAEANEGARSSVNVDRNENLDTDSGSNSKRKREIFDSTGNEETNVQLESFPLVKNKDSERDVVGTAIALQPWLSAASTDLVPSGFLKEVGNKLVSGSFDFEAPLTSAARMGLERKSTLPKAVENFGDGSSKEDGKASKRRNLAEDEAMLLSKREAWKKDNVHQLEEVAFGKDMRGKWREEKKFEKLMALDKRRDEESLKSRGNPEDGGSVNRHPENITSHLSDVESSVRIVADEPTSHPSSIEVTDEASLKQRTEERSGNTDVKNDSSTPEKSMLSTLESRINVYADDEAKGIPDQSNVTKDLQRSPADEVTANTSIQTSVAGWRNDDGVSVFQAVGEENRSRITAPEAELVPIESTASSNIAERRNEANDDESVKEVVDNVEETMSEMETDDGIEASSDHLAAGREAARLDARRKQHRRGEKREIDVESAETRSVESNGKTKGPNPNDSIDEKQNSATRLASEDFSLPKFDLDRSTGARSYDESRASFVKGLVDEKLPDNREELADFVDLPPRSEREEVSAPSDWRDFSKKGHEDSESSGKKGGGLEFEQKHKLSGSGEHEDSAASTRMEASTANGNKEEDNQRDIADRSLFHESLGSNTF